MPMPRARHDPPPPELVCLGLAMRDLREGQGLKQIELAVAADATEGQVSDIERARDNPGWTLIARLLDGLGLTVADFADAYGRAQRGELD